MGKEDKEEIAVHVNQVTKDFILPHEAVSSIKSGVVNLLKRKNRHVEVYHALKGVSFDIKKGEFFGIVGRNGSGKSTLLKIIAEIYQPTSGSIDVKGRLVPFIELGVGFNPELTGRENVFLNGALLGFSRKEVEAMYDDIVKFAELEDFMDQKLKNYSSGMQVRLAFSVAIQADADVLLIDEVLAVGDEAFQRKCLAYFAKLKKDKKTVIFVTHSMDAVQKFCDRAILIDKGHKTEIGTPLKISQIYRDLNNKDGMTVNEKDKPEDGQKGTKYVQASVSLSKLGDTVDFEIDLRSKQELEDPIVGFELFREDGQQVYRWVTDEKYDKKITLGVNDSLKIKISLQNIFPVGGFVGRLLVRRRDRSVDYGIFNEIVKFENFNTSNYQHDIFWKPIEKTDVTNE